MIPVRTAFTSSGRLTADCSVSSAKRARRTMLAGAPAAAVLVLACDSGPARSAPALAVDARASSPRTVILRADRDDPLEFAWIGSLDDSTLVAIERRTQHVWRLPLTGRAVPQRVADASRGGRRRIVGFSADRGRIAMIDRAGRISEDVPDAADPTLAAHRRSGTSRSLLGFARMPNGSFLTMESRVHLIPGHWMPRDTVTISRVVPPDLQLAVAVWERAGKTNPLGLVADFLSMRVVGETIVVSASGPPRVIRLTPGGAWTPQTFLIEGLRPPALPRSERDRMRADLERRGVPISEITKLAATYPAIIAAHPVNDGWFVVTPASGDRFSLSFACRGAPPRPVLVGADIVAIHLLASTLVVLRDRLDSGWVRVEVSSYRDFSASCS